MACFWSWDTLRSALGIMNRDRTIQDIVERLKAYKPESIVVFGSWARGQETGESDVDLLIVKRTKKRRVDRVGDILELYYPGTAVDRWPRTTIDPHVYTPEEIRRRLAMGDFFVKEIVREGRTVYGKKPNVRTK